MRGIRSRRGGILLETLLALSLGVFVLGAFSGILVASLHWSRELIGRSEALEVVRTTWVVLDDELRAGLWGRDWGLDPEGIVGLRAFRGVARLCAPTGSGSWAVAYRGRRLPDPGRDSVLVLGSDGGWRVFDLEQADGGGECSAAPGETVQRWHWSQADAPPPVLARLFERGEYHLADGALRYRRGGGGRQPLTPGRMGTNSGFRSVDGGIEVRVEFEGPSGSGLLDPFVWPVRGMDPEADW